MSPTLALKLLPYISVGALCGLAAAYGVYLYEQHQIDLMRAQYAANAVTQVKAEKDSCMQTLKHNQDVSNDYQQTITRLNRERDALRVQPTRCVPVYIHVATSRPDAAGVSPTFSGYGVTSDAIHDVDYAGLRCVAKVTALQEWISPTTK